MGDGVEISLKDVYDVVQALRTDVATAAGDSKMLAYRIEQLEKRDASASKNRPVWIGLAASTAVGLLAFFSPVIFR